MAEANEQPLSPRPVVTSSQIAKGQTVLATSAAYLIGFYYLGSGVTAAIRMQSAAPLFAVPGGLLWIGLGYGVRKQSRTCAVTLFSLWLIGQLRLWRSLDPGFVGIVEVIITLAITFAFAIGIRGTITIHKLKPAPNNPTSAA